jgi:hypothetical protein
MLGSECTQRACRSEAFTRKDLEISRFPGHLCAAASSVTLLTSCQLHDVAAITEFAPPACAGVALSPVCSRCTTSCNSSSSARFTLVGQVKRYVLHSSSRYDPPFASLLRDEQ